MELADGAEVRCSPLGLAHPTVPKCSGHLDLLANVLVRLLEERHRGRRDGLLLVRRLLQGLLLRGGIGTERLTADFISVPTDPQGCVGSS